jgi:hypothetical protein
VACWRRKLDLISQIWLTLCSALFTALLQWPRRWFVRMPEQGISSNKVILPRFWRLVDWALFCGAGRSLAWYSVKLLRWEVGASDMPGEAFFNKRIDLRLFFV